VALALSEELWKLVGDAQSCLGQTAVGRHAEGYVELPALRGRERVFARCREAGREEVGDRVRGERQDGQRHRHEVQVLEVEKNSDNEEEDEREGDDDRFDPSRAARPVHATTPPRSTAMALLYRYFR
jgi:hypothetical protein